VWYEWDPEKDAANRRKHDLRLEEGIQALNDPNVECWIDGVSDSAEIRDITLGMGRAGILFVVSVLRSKDLTRIISVRKVGKHEEHWYYHGRP
jgi:uncharacterized DUF497 family protein